MCSIDTVSETITNWWGEGKKREGRVIMRIIIIIICSSKGTDPGISEQASELCQALGLPNTNLFVMPYVDRPEGFITRYRVIYYINLFLPLSPPLPLSL